MIFIFPQNLGIFAPEGYIEEEKKEKHKGREWDRHGERKRKREREGGEKERERERGRERKGEQVREQISRRIITKTTGCALLKKIRKNQIFQWIFTVIEMSMICDIQYTQSVTIHWNFSFFLIAQLTFMAFNDCSIITKQANKMGKAKESLRTKRSSANYKKLVFMSNVIKIFFVILSSNNRHLI